MFLKISSNSRLHPAWLAGLLFAAGAALALPEDADKPITIRANEGQLDQVSRTGTYTGDVQVDQGTLRIQADRMTVIYKNQKVSQITFNGSPATYRQQLNADQEMVFANASTIIYYTQNERLQLRGDATLTQEGNELQGEAIDYDIVAGKVDARSKPEKGPIRMVVQPERSPAAEGN